MPKLELFGSAACPYTQEMKEWLEWRGQDFEEYDVDWDAAARKRLFELAGPAPAVPVLLEDGKVLQIGWQGRGCLISVEQTSHA